MAFFSQPDKYYLAISDVCIARGPLEPGQKIMDVTPDCRKEPNVLRTAAKAGIIEGDLHPKARCTCPDKFAWLYTAYKYCCGFRRPKCRPLGQCRRRRSVCFLGMIIL